MKKVYLVAGFFLLLIVIIQACSKLQPGAPADDSLLDGPVEGLSHEQNRQFLAGDVAFNDEIFTTQTTLILDFFLLF